MISYHTLTIDFFDRLSEIDRSEFIDKVYEMRAGELQQKDITEEYLGWSTAELKEIQEQYRYELTRGGLAIGAFNEDILVGFGVLGHRLMGENLDQLHVDLMYVSRDFRRKGIGSEILNRMGTEAKSRGAAYLYISSAETNSAVSFYRKNGSAVTEAVDALLFNKEPKDIHMVKKL